MKKYIKPAVKELNINTESLMDEEMAIVSDPNQQITDPNQFLGNEDGIWEDEVTPKHKSVWE